jgi:hypothetical protein
VQSTAIKFTSTRLWSQTAPLFEEECNLTCAALITHLANPVGLHRASVRATLAANYYPVDTSEVDFAYSAY